MMSNTTNRIIWAVLEELNTHEGFSEWWENLDHGIQRKIKEELFIKIFDELEGMS